MNETDTSRFDRGQMLVLEQMAKGAPLADVLRDLVLLIEEQAEGMVCSILLLDRDRRTLHHGAAPHLPREFVEKIDGSPIGPSAGSCGTAAFTGERVIVDDIATHAYWKDYRDVALPLGLRACWSSPILSPSGNVLGTFAMYYRESRGPSPHEIAWVDRATHLAAIAIRRANFEATLKLHALVPDLITDVLFCIAVEGEEQYRFISVNRTFLTSTGLSEEQVVGRLMEQVVPPQSQELVRGHYATAIRERRTVRWLEVSQYPAGRKYGEVTVTPVFDAAGECTKLVGTVHDITDHVEARARIEAQAALLDRANDAILVHDLSGRVEYWNRGAERLYGLAGAEVLGTSVVDQVYTDANEFVRATQPLLEHGSWHGELNLRARSGTPLVVEASLTLLRDAEGNPKSVLAIHTDSTEKKRLQREVLIARQMEGLGTLARGIAHDFNNILTGISANASYALSLEPARDLREPLVQIEGACRRAADLVQQILTFSRPPDGRRRRVRLEPVVSEVLNLVRASLPSRIRVEIEHGPDVPEIFADPTQVHQVILNLCTNAVQAMGDKGLLRVRTERALFETEYSLVTPALPPGLYAKLVIEDSGSGMDRPTLERIFEPFFTTKTQGTGTGLGLSMVHGIVKSHAGGIYVESTPCHGSSFSIYFPAAGS